MQVLRRDGFKPEVWKNGGGRTHEVFRVPDAGDPFRWRLSLAEIGVSGPFSDFTGYQRLLILLDGAFELRFSNGERRRLRAVGDFEKFDGALGVECELAGGASTDLNLIVTNAIVGVRASVVSLAAPLAVHLVPGATLAVFAVAGAVQVSREESAGGAGASSAELATWDAAIDLGGTGRVVRLATAPRREPTEVPVGAPAGAPGFAPAQVLGGAPAAAPRIIPAQVFLAEFSDTGAPT